MYNNIYNNKTVLVTGHTGFKGTWLTIWLLKLGAKVIGLSKDIPTQPSMFEELNIEKRINHIIADIRELSILTDVINTHKPSFIFHLAAQPIVSTSYENPIETFSSNVMGTVNVLEAIRSSNYQCTVIMITSDKAYDNVEQVWGYKENDNLGGKDIYSGSKGAAELVIKSYYHSFFSHKHCKVKVAIGRAGNVIGGGDWAKDRIVVDCMEAWSKGNFVEIRSPKATRPWQHVLEPLSGYLQLGQTLNDSLKIHGQAFNFGPKEETNHTVEDLLIDLSQYWHFDKRNIPYRITDNIPFHEASLLKLNCDKALFYLKWEANLKYQETIRFTSEWYYDFYKSNCSIFDKTIEQIIEYENLATKRRLLWTK